MNRQRLAPTSYTVAWISALPIESAAAAEMLDEVHHDPRHHGSADQYVFGRIGNHNVVMACLPSGRPGTNSAAAVAGHLLGTFSNINFGLMVGISGGVPAGTSAGIRLGDVVVGHPHLQHSGVVQYDMGKTNPDGLMRIGSLDAPPAALLSAIATLRTNSYRAINNLTKHLSVFDRLPQFYRETAGEDILYDAAYRHNGGETCEHCDKDKIVQRPQRPNKDVVVHYGTIASGNQVIKDGVTRDKLSAELGGVLCFEMEAAGLANVFKSVVIRGICDYADSHKSKSWQPYAAATAAAVAKELLLLMPAPESEARSGVGIGDSIHSSIFNYNEITTSAKNAKASDEYRVRFSLKGVPLGRFADRPGDIKQLEDALLPQSEDYRRKILVLQGLGGIGKTQLAVEFARKHQTTFTSVFWLDGSSEDSLKQSIAQCLARIPEMRKHATMKYLETPNAKNDADAVRIFMEWLSREENHSWLVIFDNVDRDYDQLDSDPYAYDLEDYLPDVDHGSILITTRLANLQQLGESLHLRSVDMNQAQAIFRKWYNQDFDPSDSDELLHLLDGLPLALAQAGAYMTETGTSFCEYIRIYKEQWKNLMETKGTTPLKSYRNRSINTTWMVSYNAIKTTNKAAANLLLIWAHLDHKTLPFWILQNSSERGLNEPIALWLEDAATDEVKFREMIRLLRNYGLVESAQGGSGHSTHPVVHQWAFHMQDEAQKSQLSQLALNIIGYATPDGHTQSSHRGQRQLFPHAESWIERIAHSLEETIDKMEAEAAGEAAYSLHQMGMLLSDLDDLRKSETIYRHALHAKELAWGPDHVWTLDTANNLGGLYRIRGKPEEAEKLCERALEGYEKAYGPEYIYKYNALNTLNNLGLLYANQGMPNKAEEIYKRALEGKEKAFGPDAVSTLDTVNNLGLVYVGQGRLQEAEEMYQRVLAGYERHWGDEFLFTHNALNTLNNLGLLYNDQRKFDKAEEYYQRCLEAKEKAFGPEHTSTLDTINNLGLLYADLGKLDEAEQMYHRALDGYEKAWGPEYILTHNALNTVNNLAILYSNQGKLQESEQQHKRALVGKERVWGFSHSSTLITCYNLAGLYVSLGKLEEAETLYRRALEEYERTLGAGLDPIWTIMDALNAAYGFGCLLIRQGHYSQAKENFVRAGNGYQYLHGADYKWAMRSQDQIRWLETVLATATNTNTPSEAPQISSSQTQELPSFEQESPSTPPPPPPRTLSSKFDQLSLTDSGSQAAHEVRDKEEEKDDDWEVVAT